VCTEFPQIARKLALFASFISLPHVLVFIASWIYFFQNLLGFEKSYDEIINLKLVDFDQNSIPLIQYYCFKKLDPLSFGFSYTDESYSDWFHIAEIKDINTSHLTYISAVDATIINSSLFNTNSTELNGGLQNLSFLHGKEDIFELFSQKTDDETAFLLNKSTIGVEDLPNLYPKDIGQKRKNTQTKFDFTIIIIILILGLVIYLAVYISPNIIPRSSTFGIIALRKRWLSKLLSSGKINEKVYSFLLSQIEDLPRWIGAKEFAHLDLPSTGADPELEVALRRRKRGESVVSTKETSLERTSR